ncbi:MAG: hypothetical protein JSS87_08335 [Acidobacteria bacterium]|nr:hypothetical protein [Acidobacteriota bacterium]
MSRRRSLSVFAPLLAATALTITTGCREKEMQRCVDEKGTVVADSLCQGQVQQRVEQRPDGHGGFIPLFIPMYRPYFGGSGGYSIGDRVYGGGYAPLPGHVYNSPSITRGGFGRSFSSHGFGE